MKNIILLLSLLISLHTIAQMDNNYKGPAKIYVKVCTAAIAKAKTETKASFAAQYIEKAQDALASIKKFDAAYNTTPLQEEIDNLLALNKDAAKTQVEQSKKNSNSHNKEGDGVAGLFMGTTTTEIRTTGNTDADIANHKLQLTAYNQKVDRLITAGVSGTGQYENYIQKLAAPSTQQIKKLEEQINKADSKLGMIAYRELVGIETYWAAAKKIFTNVPEAGEVHSMAAAALQKLGSEEQAALKIKKNYEEKIKNKKMPAAVLVNAVLEAEFKKVFTNSFKDLTIIKINIIAREWTVIRNEITGVILGRKHSAAIAVKTKEGTCALYYFHIGQQYTGSGYGLSAENARAFDGEMACENVK